MIDYKLSPVSKLTIQEALAFLGNPDLELCKAEWEWAFIVQGKEIPAQWEDLSESQRQEVITECKRYCAELNTFRLFKAAKNK